MGNFRAFREKMLEVGLSESAILAFQRNYNALCDEATGYILEKDISPVPDLVNFESITSESETCSPELLSQTVVIKLNGGLGTSMGLQKAKSLLEVRDGVTFLDVIAQQMTSLRERTGADVKFLLMNSFSTSDDSIEHLSKYEELGKREDIEFIQNQVLKICLLYTSPSPRDGATSRMPSSA